MKGKHFFYFWSQTERIRRKYLWLQEEQSLSISATVYACVCVCVCVCARWGCYCSGQKIKGKRKQYRLFSPFPPLVVCRGQLLLGDTPPPLNISFPRSALLFPSFCFFVCVLSSTAISASRLSLALRPSGENEPQKSCLGLLRGFAACKRRLLVPVT